MTAFADIKAAAKLPERSVPVCLRGDLQSEYEDLERQHRVAEAAARGTLAGSTEDATAIKELMAALRDQMRESTHAFIFRALPRKKWRDLVAEHRPRDQDRAKGLDYNQDTFPVAAIQACCIDPVMSVKEVEELCDEVLTQGQWDQLFLAVFLLNKDDIEVPT